MNPAELSHTLYKHILSLFLYIKNHIVSVFFQMKKIVQNYTDGVFIKLVFERSESAV